MKLAFIDYKTLPTIFLMLKLIQILGIINKDEHVCVSMLYDTGYGTLLMYDKGKLMLIKRKENTACPFYL